MVLAFLISCICAHSWTDTFWLKSWPLVARLEPMASISSPSAQTASLLVDGHPRRVGVGLLVPTLDDVAASLGTRLRK